MRGATFPGTGKVVLFGGSDLGFHRDDTWTWDGRLAAPAKMRRDFRRAGQRLRGAKVRLVLAARVKPHGAPARCFQKAPRRAVQLKVTGISSRAAIPARARRVR